MANELLLRYLNNLSCHPVLKYLVKFKLKHKAI